MYSSIFRNIQTKNFAVWIESGIPHKWNYVKHVNMLIVNKPS